MNDSSLLQLLIVIFAVLTLQTKLKAAIVGGMVTGGVSVDRGGVFEKLTPPLPNPFGAPNTVGEDTFNDANLYGFDEGQNIVLGTDPVELDIVPKGRSTKILPGQMVCSHFIFFDPFSGYVQGYIDFDADIFGIINDISKQKATDPLVRTDVQYLSPDRRGLDGTDKAVFDETNPRRLWLDLGASSPGDYFRVITGPSPSKVWKTAVAGLTAIDLAGFSFGTTNGLGNVAPTNSPAEVFSSPIKTGSFLTFVASGHVKLPDEFGGGIIGPDGDLSRFVNLPSQGSKSLSGCTAPVGSLVGVFLGHPVPTIGQTPKELDFSAEPLRGAVNLMPRLKQVFLIGDGLSEDGKPLRVYVPAEATRLFFGVMSPKNHLGFAGEFVVEVTNSRNPLLSPRWRNPSKIEFCWEAVHGGFVQIESSEDPVNGPWTPVGPMVVGDDRTGCLTVDRSLKQILFYRLSISF